MVSENSYSLSTGCNASDGSTTHGQLDSKVPIYLRLRNAVDYFATKFVQPVKYGVNIRSGSCLGIHLSVVLVWESFTILGPLLVIFMRIILVPSYFPTIRE